ncbi:uncharacterized protein EDB91DRAFT_68536 [Suillus paluster]|uniref:uncharacterized protein n=1 Tax=Suillus paluster TaxID=48578 RepID=UPI001B87D451|nr:uncharacterized protein EDB91DRAFT_68536 [Suillus paluster]KAG1747107.1 hypothetical protein EDB91DRAFT_68536 [Suillus paluster]
MSTSLLPPPGTNYLATIQSSIPFLLTGTVLSSLLIPILIALLVFSTPDTRRHPNFVLNVLGILLGLAEGAVNIYLMVHTMLSPTVPETTAALTSMPALTFFGPLVVESTLVIRLAAVYPRRSTPKVKFWSILLTTISLKTIRSVNVFIFLHRYVIAISGAGNPISAGDSLWGSWQTKLEWILQAVDNAFVSFMFLRRLPRNTSDSEGAVRSKALATRLRGLFLIALSNFVFPVILNLIQLGLVFGSKASFFQTSLVYMVNNYVNIIGVVFATIWSIGSRRLEESQAPPRLWASEASTITSKRVHSPRGSQNFKPVNLAEGFEFGVKEPRTAPYTASQSDDGRV